MLSSAFLCQPLQRGFQVKLTAAAPPLHLTDGQRQLVDDLWLIERKLKGHHLFDGTVFSALHYDEKGLQGHFVPYKYYLAQQRAPQLRQSLKITPVAVTGITRLNGNLLVAKRALWVTQYPDFYELAPSGGITPRCVEGRLVHLNEQIFEELFDEVGITRSCVETLDFFSLIHEKESGNIELCAELMAKPLMLQSVSGEYSQLLSVPIEELASFVETTHTSWVPLSLQLLKIRKYL